MLVHCRITPNIKGPVSPTWLCGRLLLFWNGELVSDWLLAHLSFQSQLEGSKPVKAHYSAISSIGKFMWLLQLNLVWFMESFEQGGPNDSRRNFNGSAVDANEDEKDFVNITGEIACVNGGSGYPRKLRSRTRVQKAAQVARRMGRSLF